MSQPHQVELAQQLYDASDTTIAQIAELFDVSRTTVYGHFDHTTVDTQTRAQRQA